MKAVRGAARLLLPLSLLLSGCVRQAVLENDIQSAIWKSRTLSTATDLQLAHAALAAQLVELEALYQRSPGDPRPRELLVRGYRTMARGFIELRRLDAIAGADHARAQREERLQADAEARARYYQAIAPATSPDPASKPRWEGELTEAEGACRSRDQKTYERTLNALLARPWTSPEARLEDALLRQLAAAWLMPNVAVRCGF